MGELTPVRAPQRVFGLVKPGDIPSLVQLARATEHQPGGPETLVPVNAGPYVPVPLAPGAVIRVTAPIYDGDLADWLAGAEVTPEQFARLSQQAEQRYGPLPARARMFRVWLDESGRATKLQHIFSP